MIWADKVAIGIFALIMIVLGIGFVTSDAPLREAAYNARAAKFAAACAPHPATEPEAAAPTEKAESADTEVSTQDASPQQQAAPLDDRRLPASLCYDEALKAAREAEAEAIRAPTVGDLALESAEAGLFFVAPLWVGLRVLDLKTGGPTRRLARNPYWKTTRQARKSQSRERQRSSERHS